MTQLQGLAIQVEHGCRIGVLLVGGVVGEPCGLRQVRFFGWLAGFAGRHAGSRDLGRWGESEGPAVCAGVRSHPGQRHAAAVTTLLRLVAHTVERGRVLELIPRNVGHFGESEFLALIHVCGSGQRKLHQDGGASATRTLLPILGVTRAVT